MQDNPFVILGVSETATQAEIFDAYVYLRDKYAEERFLEGEAGAEAARKLSEVQYAYEEALKRKTTAGAGYTINTEAPADAFSEIRRLIKDGKIAEAQIALDDIMDRSSEWHYMQAKIYHEKNWFTECKKQLEMAVSMQPDNKKYKDTLDRLKSEMSGNFAFGEKQQHHQSRPQNGFAPAGRSYSDGAGCCNCCGNLLCADCCCECMGGDLIPCC